MYAADQLFATLDPTMRRVNLPGNLPVILADTVGFIRDLPHDLVAAFKSTLEEVAEAELLLHVVDAASAERLDQMQRVNEVLAEIEASAIPQIVVFNKIDLTGRGAAPGARRRRPGGARLAPALTGAGTELLLEAVAAHFRTRHRHYRLYLPPEAGRLRALLYERFNVHQESPLAAGGWQLDVTLNRNSLPGYGASPAFEERFLPADDTHVLAPHRVLTLESASCCAGFPWHREVPTFFKHLKSV